MTSLGHGLTVSRGLYDDLKLSDGRNTVALPADPCAAELVTYLVEGGYAGDEYPDSGRLDELREAGEALDQLSGASERLGFDPDMHSVYQLVAWAVGRLELLGTVQAAFEQVGVPMTDACGWVRRERLRRSGAPPNMRPMPKRRRATP